MDDKADTTTAAAVRRTRNGKLHHPRQHAAVRTDDYIFSQLIPYIGNKRKLLHLIDDAVSLTGCTSGTFVDLFTGSTVVARWAKQGGFRVVANDWEPYSHQIALGTIVPNEIPPFAKLGGAEHVFKHLNSLRPVDGYVATHLCPRDDENPDPEQERMFFTRENGEKIDAIGEQVQTWTDQGLITDVERAYIMAAFVYAVSYASNTSGVFKGFHYGWGGKTATALYRIRGKLTLTPPVVIDNGVHNLAVREDAQALAGRLDEACGAEPDIVYIDPPYNQHPYGSNYHVLNTVVLWDKPRLNPSILVNGKKHDKSAIRKDWCTERRSAYNSAKEASTAFKQLIKSVRGRWALVSYSTDGNIPLDQMITIMANRGTVHVVTEKYKRYRVSTPRMSKKSHNIEFVAVLDLHGSPSERYVDALVEQILHQEKLALSNNTSDAPLFDLAD